MRSQHSVFLALAATLSCSGVPSASTANGPAAPFYPPRDLSSRHPQTRAERSGFTETSRYADVMGFIDTLKQDTKQFYVTTIGKSPQGRDIPLVVLSRPAVKTPGEAKRLNRPIVYIQGNIHGGEVEGKEALLSLLRDLSQDIYRNVADSMVILAVPIYNIDGNEAFGPQARNRSEQNGPEQIGQRANGQGLDLNRDYIKAEAPETRAALDLFRAWEPDVFVDLHTTDGSYHGYALTYAPSLNPAAIFTGPFTRDTVLPTLRNMLREHEQIEIFPYGNFISQDSVERGWVTYDHRPRFGTNYWGLRGRVSILSEAYSHDPFKRRITATYGFVAELLTLIAANTEDFMEAGREADRRTTAFSSNVPTTSPPLAIRSRLTRTPRVEEMRIEEILKSPDTVLTEPGLNRGERRTGKVRTAKVPVYDRFDPVLTQTLPYAWIIPAEQQSLLELLRRHGVFVEQVGERAVVRGETFTIDSVIQSPRPFQNHREVQLNGRWNATDSLAIDPSAFVIRAGQPLGILALYLLEPQSDDGLTSWNFLDQWLTSGRYPIARVLNRIPVPLRAVR